MNDDAQLTAVAARAAARAPILRTLAQNLHGIREAFDWSMKLAAERSGVARGTIKSIEAFRGNPGASTIFRLANGFGLTFANLIDPNLLTHLPSEPPVIARYPDPDALSLALGPKIVLARRRRQLGRVKFAQLCGVSKSMLLYVESGRVEPSLTVLERIASGLQVSLSELVEGHDSPIVSRGARWEILSRLQSNGAAEMVRDGETGGVKLTMTELALSRHQRVAFPAGDIGARAVIYVLTGYARVIGPAGEHSLNFDEAIIVTADVPLTIMNRGDEPARVLHVSAAPPSWNERDDRDATGELLLPDQPIDLEPGQESDSDALPDETSDEPWSAGER